MKIILPAVRPSGAVCLFAATLLSSAAMATDLTGSSVTGSLQFSGDGLNYFSPANGFVPAGYGNSSPGNNTVTIGAITEFGFFDGDNTDTANFTGSTLTVGDVMGVQGASSWVMLFTDPTFAGLSIAELTDTFPNGGATATLEGTTLTVTWAGFGNEVLSSPGSQGLTSQRTVSGLTATYQFNTAEVPEVGQVSMLAAALGTVGVAGLLRRRNRK